MNCPRTWWGAATKGRSAFKLPPTRSERPYAVSSRSKASRTREMFITTAATYQIERSAATTAITGTRSAIARRRHRDRSRGHDFDAALSAPRALLVIGMSRAQAHAHPPGDVQEFGRFANFKRAITRQVAGDDIDDAAGAWRHHHDPPR